ncbi:hypothetical protein ACS0TY_022206 [Phlomoides rotata]
MELRRVSVELGLERRRLEFRSPRDFDCASDYSGGQIENGREYNPAPYTNQFSLSLLPIADHSRSKIFESV